jgi:hypothetical protein
VIESVESVANFIDLSAWLIFSQCAIEGVYSTHCKRFAALRSQHVRAPPLAILSRHILAMCLGCRATCSSTPSAPYCCCHTFTHIRPSAFTLTSLTRAVLPPPHLMHMQVWKSCRIHSSLRKASWPNHHLHGKQMSAGPSPPPAQSGSWERAVKCLTMCALRNSFGLGILRRYFCRECFRLSS